MLEQLAEDEVAGLPDGTEYREWCCLSSPRVYCQKSCCVFGVLSCMNRVEERGLGVVQSNDHPNIADTEKRHNLKCSGKFVVIRSDLKHVLEAVCANRRIVAAEKLLGEPVTVFRLTKVIYTFRAFH